jgi:hypothetical protein
MFRSPKTETEVAPVTKTTLPVARVYWEEDDNLEGTVLCSPSKVGIRGRNVSCRFLRLSKARPANPHGLGYLKVSYATDYKWGQYKWIRKSNWRVRVTLGLTSD